MEFIAIIVNNTDGPDFGSLDLHAGEAFLSIPICLKLEIWASTLINLQPKTG